MSENQSKNIVNEWVSANTNRLTEIQTKNPDLYGVVNSALNYLSSYLGGATIEAQKPILSPSNDVAIPNDILKLVENLYVEGMTIDNSRILDLPDNLKRLDFLGNLPITFRYENRTRVSGHNSDKYNVVYLIYGDKFEMVVFSDMFYDPNDSKTYENSFAGGDENYKPIITALPFAKSPIAHQLDYVSPSDLKKAYDVVRLKQTQIPEYKKYVSWLFNLFGVVYSIIIKVGSDEWKTYMNTIGRSVETAEIEFANDEYIYVYYYSVFEKYRNKGIFKSFEIAIEYGIFKLNDGIVYTYSDKYLTPNEIDDIFYQRLLNAFFVDFQFNNLTIPKLIDESDFYLGKGLQQPPTQTTKVVLTAQENARLNELQAKEDTSSLTSAENLEYEKLVEKYRQTDDYLVKDDFQDLLDDIENLDI